MHEPQSCGQLFWFSKQLTLSHLPSPHVQEMTLQSAGQVIVVSPHAGSHLKSPQTQEPPQSMGQLFGVSTHCGWQKPFPQMQALQSMGHVAWFSPQAG